MINPKDCVLYHPRKSVRKRFWMQERKDYRKYLATEKLQTSEYSLNLYSPTCRQILFFLSTAYRKIQKKVSLFLKNIMIMNELTIFQLIVSSYVMLLFLAKSFKSQYSNCKQPPD